jgi:hypothetical protein
MCWNFLPCMILPADRLHPSGLKYDQSWGQILCGCCDLVLICHDSQCYKEFCQLSTEWPPSTPVVSIVLNSTFSICPTMGLCLLLPPSHQHSHLVFDSKSRPRCNVFSASGHYLLLAPTMFKSPELSITFSYAEIWCGVDQHSFSQPHSNWHRLNNVSITLLFWNIAVKYTPSTYLCPIYNVDSDHRYGGHILNADGKE